LNQAEHGIVERLSNWLQVAGNLGVVVGLVFVGYQLVQDRELKRTELMFWTMDTLQQLHLSLAGEQPHESLVKLAIAPDDATEEDRYIASKVFDAIMFGRRKVFLMQEADLFEELGESVFVDYEFGSATGSNYLRTQLETFNISDRVKRKYQEAYSEAGFEGRLLRYLREDLGTKSQELAE
jgi:hypothetical protein